MSTGDQPVESARDFTVSPDSALPKISEEDFQNRAADVLRGAKSGQQVAIVSKDGRIKAIVGMNGVRFLPDPEVDLLDDCADEEKPVTRQENRVNPWVD